MKHYQMEKLFFIKRCILVIVGMVLCFGSLSISAADYTNDDAMLRKLFDLHYKLAQQGNLESITRLGLMYERGEGVKKDRQKAIELYQAAADKGYKPAQKLLANIQKSGGNNKIDVTDNLRVPKDKSSRTKQRELQERLEREKAAAEEARKELERLRQSKQEEALKQQKLLQEIENVKKAQEQLAQERAKAEATRRQVEELRKKQEQELRKQEAQRQALQRQQELSEKQQQQQQTTSATVKPEVQEKKPEKTFSSDPCKTPAARFMSTCN